MLRNLSRNALIHLTQLFNHLLLLGHFPTNWKTEKVIPTPKPKKPHTDPNSYRPISLLSTLGKLFESIIAARLTSFVQQHQLIPHFQFGFLRKPNWKWGINWCCWTKEVSREAIIRSNNLPRVLRRLIGL